MTLAAPLLSSLLLVAVAALVSSACTFRWEPAFDEKIDPSTFGNVAIADPAQALTFARVETDGHRGPVLVTRYADGMVEGVDLSAALGVNAGDPIGILRTHGYEKLSELAAGADAQPRISVPVEKLVAPVDLQDRHIAAGTNFPEHADDAGVEDGPFLFAKLVAPTAPSAPVSAGDALLDYEVEAAWVTLEPLAQGREPEHMGVILSNDYTDRATLLRHADPWDVASGTGFATGKSFPGYLPVGDLFVIPRDFRRFVEDLELRLYVNDRLRQSSPARLMVWDFDEILAQTWARRDRTWEHRGEQIALPGASGVIPERTLILSGTPHGTVFDGIRRSQMAFGALAWAASGFSRGVPAHVVDRYIDEARAADIYLQPGDRVAIHVDRLGGIRNSIVE